MGRPTRSQAGRCATSSGRVVLPMLLGAHEEQQPVWTTPAVDPCCRPLGPQPSRQAPTREWAVEPTEQRCEAERLADPLSSSGSVSRARSLALASVAYRHRAHDRRSDRLQEQRDSTSSAQDSRVWSAGE